MIRFITHAGEAYSGEPVDWPCFDCGTIGCDCDAEPDNAGCPFCDGPLVDGYCGSCEEVAHIAALDRITPAQSWLLAAGPIASRLIEESLHDER